MLCCGPRRRRLRALLQTEGERHDRERRAAEDDERRLPAELADQRVLDRQHQELAERAGCRRHAHRPRSLLRCDIASDDAEHDRIRRPRLRHAEHHAGAAGEAGDRRRHRHQRQPAAVEQAADDQHAPGAEAVGDHARERAGEAPHQVLHREREGEVLARPAAIHRHRLQPQPETVADAHRQRHDRGAAQQHLRHRQPASLRQSPLPHCSQSASPAGCACLESPHGDQARQIRRSIDPRAEGPRARQAAPGHVHPHREPAALHPGGDRQRRRRGARRLRQAPRADAACRRLGQRRGRRPRHSVRPAPRGAGAGGRDRLHAAARRRQVRQGRGRRVQLLRRPARRRA